MEINFHQYQNIWEAQFSLHPHPLGSTIQFAPPLQIRNTIIEKKGGRKCLHNYSHLFFLSLQKLTKGSNNWSVSEVTQALIILSHFHTLSGFIFGCGISSEIDDDLGHTYHQSYDDSYENGCHSDDDEQVSKKLLVPS